MGNMVECALYVLADGLDEVNNIEAALQEPSRELVARFAGSGENIPDTISQDVRALVTFNRDCCVSGSDVGVGGFVNSFSDCFWVFVRDHLRYVSGLFPSSVFLLEFSGATYVGQVVITGGKEIREVRDNRRYDGPWAFPNIFIPFVVEHELEMEVCSLWGEWVSDVDAAVRQLAPAAGTRPSPKRSKRQKASDSSSLLNK
jgi:hypothetical protein